MRWLILVMCLMGCRADDEKGQEQGQGVASDADADTDADADADADAAASGSRKVIVRFPQVFPVSFRIFCRLLLFPFKGVLKRTCAHSASTLENKHNWCAVNVHHSWPAHILPAVMS